MANERDNPDALGNSFRAESQRRQMAEHIYYVARFIKRKDFFGGSQVNRDQVEKSFTLTIKFSRRGRELIRESIGILLQKISHDKLLVSKRGVPHIGRREGFSLKTDANSKAQFSDILAYFAEQGGLDAKTVEGHRSDAARYKGNGKFEGSG